MKSKLIFITLVFLTGYICEIKSQSFTNVNSGIVGTIFSASAWGDYDKDGDLDLIQTGSSVSTAPYTSITKIYRNDGGNVFTNINANVIGINSGSVDWGDYDNDGDLDILITGDASLAGGVTRIYRNNGGDKFTDINAGLTGVRSSCGKWGDYNKDGYLDFIIIGENPGYVTQIYRNNKNGTFTNINASFIKMNTSTFSDGSVDWGDYDNDGDLDLLISASTFVGFKTVVYRNDGNGIFTDINAGLQGIYQSSVDWGDYDNDGDLDILMDGRGVYAFYSIIYRNDGNGTFTNINAGLTGVEEASAEWGDYDNDCDLDALICGGSGVGNDLRITKVYRNNGNDSFTEDVSLNLNGVSVSSSIWGDYDKDGDLDIFISGSDNTHQPAAMVYRNNLNTIKHSNGTLFTNDDIFISNCISTTTDFNILENDLFDPKTNNTLSIVSVKHGSVAILANKNIQYTPQDPSFSRDTIIYKLCGDYCSKQCDTAIVVICRTCPAAPNAMNDTIATCLNGCEETLLIDVLKNDANIQHTYTSILNMNSQAGSASVQNGGILYNPNYDYKGTNIITYSICSNSFCSNLCDTASVSICLDPIKIFIPNLVTNNKDGLNDYFSITGLCAGAKLIISNRWGEVVYTSNDYQNDWSGENLSDGIYYYNIENSSGKKNWKGWVQLTK